MGKSSSTVSAYVRPAAVPAAMGSSAGALDERLEGVVRVIDMLSFDGVETVLDVGTGSGQVALRLAARGLKVAGTGLELGSYEVCPEMSESGRRVAMLECSAQSMPFPDGAFDMVIMSHVLEHCQDMGAALTEICRITADDGRLVVFVPPYTSYICSGHVVTGWNVGQLMYVLLLNGFRVRDGQFLEDGPNVCGIVHKLDRALPPLRGDRGDIHILAKAGHLPAPLVHGWHPPPFETCNPDALVSSDEFDDGFHGRIRCIGWRMGGCGDPVSRKHQIAARAASLIPSKWRAKLKALL